MTDPKPLYPNHSIQFIQTLIHELEAEIAAQQARHDELWAENRELWFQVRSIFFLPRTPFPQDRSMLHIRIDPNS